MRRRQQRQTVFVAEDDSDLRAALGQTLAEEGYEPILFPTAEMLLRALGEHMPAAIVTDVTMPGLSGLAMLAILREREVWRRIPIVVMTANNDTALPIRLDAPVVYKPDAGGLLLAIRSVLRRPDRNDSKVAADCDQTGSRRE